MDIFAHGLWTSAGAKLVNKKTTKEKLSVLQTAFWGIFPDLFAFGIPFSVLIFNVITGQMGIDAFAHHSDMENNIGDPSGNFPFHTLAYSLYNISHSIVVFMVVFGIVWCIRKKPVYELCGWLLHILIDIPTHSSQFYPTPVFWPVWGWKFLHGFSWGVWWFQCINYACIIIVYIWLYRQGKKNKS